ncbi:hypothetical protein [Risungbinella massiliensis]|uniref:hypothetical protein n=1 Tax=Risungbinella massiliensis TaxID=1329796 RepID=UPI0005CBBF72|nr:hypothetical protein [Risungbinella massiliensis]
MSDWQAWEMERRIREVLEEGKEEDGVRWMLSYQVAFGVIRKDSQFLEQSGMEHSRLVQYIASQLVQRIRDGRIEDMEVEYLSNRYATEIEIEFDGNELEGRPSSMFRLRAS